VGTFTNSVPYKHNSESRWAGTRGWAGQGAWYVGIAADMKRTQKLRKDQDTWHMQAYVRGYYANVNWNTQDALGDHLRSTAQAPMVRSC
jgi:hypothetical protein